MLKESITNLERFAEEVGSESVWVGIDVHKRSYHAALRSASGTSETFVAPGEPGVLVNQLLQLGQRVTLVV